jgi:hypothetical protein
MYRYLNSKMLDRNPARPPAFLIHILPGFPQLLQANAGIVISIRAQLFPFKFFTINYSPIISYTLGS